MMKRVQALRVRNEQAELHCTDANKLAEMQKDHAERAKSLADQLQQAKTLLQVISTV